MVKAELEECRRRVCRASGALPSTDHPRYVLHIMMPHIIAPQNNLTSAIKLQELRRRPWLELKPLRTIVIQADHAKSKLPKLPATAARRFNC